MNPIILIVVVAIGVLLAALAIGRRRNWLVVIPAAVVIGAIVLALIVPAQTTVATWIHVALGVGFAAIGVLGGSPVVGLVLAFAQGGVELGKHGGIVVDDEPLEPERPKGKRKPGSAEREILRGGVTIGYLERLALIGAIAVGQPSAIAIIIAIKGLGRFSELHGSEARERFIIGTLTSLTWAGACAAAALLVA